MNKTKYLTLPVIIAEIALTLALILGLFVGYHFIATSAQTDKAQNQAQSELADKWSTHNAKKGTIEETDEVPGEAVGLIRAPKLGDDWQYAFFRGTDKDTLAKGPGMYPYYSTKDTKHPSVKNLGLAAHRDGWDAPFENIDQFDTCDQIDIEYRTKIVHYLVLPTSGDPVERRQQIKDKGCFNSMPEVIHQITDVHPYDNLEGVHVTDPSDVNVVMPIPGNPNVDAEPSELPGLNLLTLTSCHPHWSNDQRIVVHALAWSTTKKTAP